MSSSSLYLLPAIAAAILLQGSLVTIKGNLLYRSRRVQHRIRARVTFFRALVVALLLATAIVRFWQFADLPLLVQGVAWTVLLMLPVTLYVLIQRYLADRRYRHQDRNEPSESNSTGSGPVRQAEFNEQSPDIASRATRVSGLETSTAAGAPPSMSRLAVAAENTEDPDTEEPSSAPEQPIGLEDTVTPSYTQTEQGALPPRSHRARPSRKSAVNTSLLSGQSPDSDPEEDIMDLTLGTIEQLESLDSLVNFHDIGDEGYATDMAGSAATGEPVNPLENAIAVARKGILEEPGAETQASENLPARSTAELAEMVVRLRSDKMKLQKLVIAQKAVIDAEKQAHERTRVVVKDAISVMRHARHGQRIAEKIARRERAERQRLEKDVDKLRKQLNNAMSTVGAPRETESEAH